MIVGIIGGSASGKSTLTRQLALSLEEIGRKCQTISLDSFFKRDEADGPFVEVEGFGRYLDFNHPDGVDWENLASSVSNATSEIVLVEGHLLGCKADLVGLDRSFYLEVDDDVRFIRRLTRDMAGGRMSADPHFISAYYLACAKPGHEAYVVPSRQKADLILNGAEPVEEMAETALNAISQWTSQMAEN